MEGLAWEGPCDADDRAGVGGVGALAVREREARARSDTLPEAVPAFAKAQIGRKEAHGVICYKKVVGSIPAKGVAFVTTTRY